MMLRLFRQYYPIRNIFFVIGEGLFICLSVVIASRLIIGTGYHFIGRWLLLKIFIVVFTIQSCLYFNDLYDLKVSDTMLETGIRLLQALGISAFILAVSYFVFPDLIIEKGVFALSVFLIIVIIILWRLGYMLVLNRGVFNQKIILLGSGEMAQKIETEIHDKKDSGYTVSVKVQESGNTDNCYTKGATPCILKKNYEGLGELAKKLKIRKIIVAITEKRGTFPTQVLLKCRVDGIDIIEGNSFYETLTGKLIVEEINPSWLIFSEGFRKSMARRFIKRSEDLLLSFILLVFFIPLIVLVALLIKMDSRGPVIFSQKRVGKNRKAYRVYKFRSMIADAEKLSGPVWAKGDDGRITRVGKWIRNLRIDEIPQLWNVLKGHMSFVGPRPEREFFVKQLEEAIPFYGERFTVKPGITGWAQISYGYGASVEDAIEKLNYDLFYIKNMSTFMDLMIVFRTVKIVLFGKGAR
jgi:sugar transferase (PEP-CTERM system associated)